MTFTVKNRIPKMGTLNMQFPAQNSQINSVTGLTLPSAISMFPGDKDLLNVSGFYQVSLSLLMFYRSAAQVQQKLFQLRLSIAMCTKPFLTAIHRPLK